MLRKYIPVSEARIKEGPLRRQQLIARYAQHVFKTWRTGFRQVFFQVKHRLFARKQSVSDR
ncbi:hypothetical protein PAECIP111802_01786 [Paenibacillus allorhizosphaerae]|uniref:Uncharacterized protein n=1 Tax=Paenibacillus allorhizosphaerae TaxID=2849866 RepID=A0ABM8VEL1_9BACL|nr:hypothetical protein PAECIP111802_01786 [Paenibacillus allorhizosphaerae]